MRSKFLRSTSLLLFFLGVVTAMLLFGSLTWASLEAAFYFGYGIQGVNNLDLDCPRLLTAADSASVTAMVRNTTDRDVEPRLEANISSNLLRSEEVQIQLPAGQSAPVTWQVGPTDVVFDHLIIVRIYQFQAFVLPSADANCGILFLDTPALSGAQVLAITISVSLFGTLAGLALWAAANQPLTGRPLDLLRGMLFLGGLCTFGLALSWIGLWVAGVLLFALAAFMLVILLTRYVLAPESV